MSDSQQNILSHFDELADEYDEFTKGIPNYREMMEVIQEVFNQWNRTDELGSVLELGTGTGQLGRAVVDAYNPDVYRGLDGSENMVDRTQSTFSDYEGTTTIEIDRREFSTWEPSRSYDLIYSSLAVHHLTNPGKFDLFETIHEALNPGGHFLLCDVFRRRKGLLDFYRIIKQNRLLAGGLSEEEAGKHWESHVPNRTLLDWENFHSGLEEVGFTAVDCVWRDMYRAIFIADSR